MSYLKIDVDPIHYNSQCITFPEWVSLFTLCLAPLIAHLISGTPTVSYLTHRRPRWYNRLCSYNPTSIIWRYAAITDRRIRAIQWSRHDLAATNAIFWTSSGWNGGEDMVTASAPHCLRYPESTHVEIASLTMLKTVITTLQGVSALYLFIRVMSGAGFTGSAIGFGVDTLFFPLAILGLLRLCAATWLTEDFVYQLDSLRNIPPTETATQVDRITMKNDNDIELDDASRALAPFITTSYETAGFRSPEHSWWSRVFRILFLLLLGGIWTLALLIMTPILKDDIHFTTTSFLLGLFYFLSITVSLFLYMFYFYRGQTTTTILPCISSTWYMLYTLLLMGLLIALIVIASIETNKVPTGMYTSVEIEAELACPRPGQMFWAFSDSSPWAGFATDRKLEEGPLTGNQTGVSVVSLQETGSQDFWLWNFTGYCVGNFDEV